MPFSRHEKGHQRCYLQSQHYQKLQASHPLEVQLNKSDETTRILSCIFFEIAAYFKETIYIVDTIKQDCLQQFLHLALSSNAAVKFRNINVIQLPD